MELKQNNKPKKSILNSFLIKRSSRVEPHPYDDQQSSSSGSNLIATNQSNHIQNSVSANSTPIKRLYNIGKLNKIWRCYYSTQSVNSTDSFPSTFLRNTNKETKAKNRNLINRHSHPISNSSDSRIVDKLKLSPDSGDYNLYGSYKEDNNSEQSSQISKQNGRIDVHLPNSNQKYYVNSSNDGASTSQELIPFNEQQNSSGSNSPKSPASSSHDGFFVASSSVPPDYQIHSIAMSACRSRLRQKLLPPSCSVDAATEKELQHFSSPNIMEKDKQQSPTPFQHRNSRSYSYDMLTNAKRTGKTESLAKNSLMAAQLINLIPTEVARERSYLANSLAVNSLLGPGELDRVLPTREIKIFVGTWNMNGQHPPKQMNDFILPPSVEHVPDLAVIGTQESSSERFEWEVVLQETLGPSHVMLHSTYLGTLHLAVFIRRDLIWFCSVPEDDCLSVRPGTAFRTKGAIAISFCLFGTSMLFVTSHLTAHQQKVKERVSDVKRIIHSLDLPKNLHLRSKNKDVTQNFDAVFWCGDLNFRLGEPRDKLLKWIENTQFPLPSHLPHGYMHTDQLKSVLSNGAAFKDFKEANITFPPTYKYDPGTQQFDTSSKQRAPAYTDRILYKFKSNPFGIRRESNITNFLHNPLVECLSYDSVPSIVSSDHKPVWALFKVCIKPGIDSIPLAAGLFNREVYLEGMKRRLTKTHYSDSSNACSIQ